LTEEETKKKIDAAIAQWRADYLQWNTDYEAFLRESVLNPWMSRRAKKRWDKAQRKKAKGKK
jgi:hypothetical protein